MNLAVLGYGNIGGTIGKKWAQAGHTVTFGGRHPEAPGPRAMVDSLGPRASLTTTTIAEAIPQGQVGLFAIPGSARGSTRSSRPAAPSANTATGSSPRSGSDSPTRDWKASTSASD